MDSVKKICELFWDLEARYDLLDWEVCGVKVWQYLRMPLYFQIAQSTGILEKPHTTVDGIGTKLKCLPSVLKAAFLKNPFRGKGQVDALVIEHDRSKEVDGRRIDIYSHYLQEELRNSGALFHTLERPHLGRHEKTDSPNRYHLDRLMLAASVQKRLMRVHMSATNVERFQMLELEILRATGHPIDLRARFDWAIRHFKASYAQIARLLDKRKPSRLYLVVSYGQGEVIKAAKDRGIETVEIQHGAFSKYHLGYSFPCRTTPLDYFPDTFYTWSDFWATMMPLPAKHIVNAGFAYMDANRAQYRDVVRRPDQILVLSQGSIGERIANTIWENHDALGGFQLVFKLHPGEYDRWQTYPSLAKLAQLPNVRVATDEDLYGLFAQSQYQVGVYSTAIYEGLEFGCRTILLELPGIEYMDHLRKRDDVCMLDQFLADITTPA